MLGLKLIHVSNGDPRSPQVNLTPLPRAVGFLEKAEVPFIVRGNKKKAPSGLHGNNRGGF